MSDLDFSNMDVHELASKLYYNKNYNAVDINNQVALIDPILANKLDYSNLCQIYYYLNASYLPEVMPNTKDKINKIFISQMSTGSMDWWSLNRFYAWINNECMENIVNVWLSRDAAIPNNLLNNSLFLMANKKDVGIKILQKLVDNYKSRKSYCLIGTIEKIFTNIHSDDLELGCEILSKSTPAISTCILKRNDIPEKYISGALKSLGKLSAQKNISAKVDFKLLDDLGPKSRLKTIQQLLGVLDWKYKALSYYKPTDPNYQYVKQRYEDYGVQKEMPFKELPSREELEKFLFPCSIKFNDEVVSLMTRYDELVLTIKKQKGEINGKC